MLEELYRNDLDPHLSEIAHHLAAGGAARRRLERRSTTSSGRATAPPSLLAYEEAGVHYERALGPARRRRGGLAELPLRAAAARSATPTGGRATRAPRGSSFEEAAELARRLGDGEMLARAALGYVIGLGGFLLFARFEAGATGIGLLEEALAALPETDSPLRARVLARLAIEMYSLQRGRAAARAEHGGDRDVAPARATPRRS